MKTKACLWIDRRRAVAVIVSDDGGRTLEIRSKSGDPPGRMVENGSQAPFEGQGDIAVDDPEWEFMGYLNQYYGAVADALRGSESILIFGQLEAKGQLRKRLEHEKFQGAILAGETSAPMAGQQVAAKAREYFIRREEEPPARKHTPRYGTQSPPRLLKA